MPFKVRELTHAQLRACGEFSLIPDFHRKLDARRVKMRDLVAYADVQHKIVRAALVQPTYEELTEKIGAAGDGEKKKAELSEMKKKLEHTPRGRERIILEEEIDSMRIWIDLILPDDFIGYVVAYTTGYNKSEIKNLTEEMLLDAAILAEKGSKRPSEILCTDGFWSPFMEADIDRRAWLVLHEFRESHKQDVKKTGLKIGRR